MKFILGKILAPLMLLGLTACIFEPEQGDFTATELRDLTPIMRFIGNPIPKRCMSDENVTYRDGKHPVFRIECTYDFEELSELYTAIERMDWVFDEEKGTRGDCGPKHEYTRTVEHRKLRLYVKSCTDSDRFSSGDLFLFRVEYD